MIANNGATYDVAYLTVFYFRFFIMCKIKARYPFQLKFIIEKA